MGIKKKRERESYRKRDGQGGVFALSRVPHWSSMKLDTICSGRKEKDSTYSEVINIVVCLGPGPATGLGSDLGSEVGSDP